MFKHYVQYDTMDCGPTCLRMVAKHYGKNYSLETLRNLSYLDRKGVSLMGISEAAESIGFKTIAIKVNSDVIKQKAKLPCILHWNQNHFVVLHKIKRNPITGKYQFAIADPAGLKVNLEEAAFNDAWLSPGTKEGVALMLEPGQAFYNTESERDSTAGFSMLVNYVKPYKQYFIQLVLAMVVGSFLELLFPFLTQSLVDNGITNRNIGFVNLILASQLMLFAGKMFVEIIRSWLLLHISARINISIISDFINKLMKLPLPYFDTKLIGDITQRIGDHHRIEQFLTGSSLATFFALINLVVFSLVMAYYNLYILLIFFFGSIISIGYVLLFLRWRKGLDYVRFGLMSDNQNQVYEMINGISEIKINNAELHERWSWERIQAKIFKLNTRSLALEQWQMSGSRFIDQLKNILISFMAAKAVVQGDMTLGMMMSISYIVGQMNAPIDQLINFFRNAQDASISLDRLKEIHEKQDEDSLDVKMNFIQTGNQQEIEQDLVCNNLCFKYNAIDDVPVFENLNLTIPKGKITAIVGTSGSGKTTLLKLLLKFYEPQKGNIMVGKHLLTDIPADYWRSKCGVVMQDGYIFGKTIGNNIAIGQEEVSRKALEHAAHVANILSYINELPLKFNTKIGAAGNGLSQGQKQRILIARAVYKKPGYIFFDEATSSLDANNESVIMSNLNDFFKGRTVVVVAHRLSTVKNADKIVVLEKGRIIEEGTHEELSAKKGAYYNLVKNQLELGN